MALRSFSCRNWSKACSASLSSLSILWSAISSSRNSVSSRFFSVRFTVREYWKKEFRIYLKPYTSLLVSLYRLEFKFFNTNSVHSKNKKYLVKLLWWFMLWEIEYVSCSPNPTTNSEITHPHISRKLQPISLWWQNNNKYLSKQNWVLKLVNNM